MGTNRKHEYRGRAINRKNTWFVGDLRQKDGETWIFPFDEPPAIDKHKVEPSTVGEFVGFFNGFKVFEGDIIHLKGKEYDKDFGVVRWHENGYFYIDDSFGEFPKDCVKPVGDFFDSISTDFKGTQITVSGNIHDRPELWKGGAR